MTAPNDTNAVLVLLYDGLCGFCDGTVRFVLARDPGGSMRFATLQGDFAKRILSKHAALAGLDSLIVVETDPHGEETVHTQSGAVLRIARYLGGRWRLVLPFRIIPRFLRDAAYATFARYRYRLFGRLPACPIPPPEARERFID
jgi:predicted DCC family thiol-disulfide oxidoreductase YuxK